jgi:hypothetical protein
VRKNHVLNSSQGNKAFPNADGGPEKKSMAVSELFIEVHQVLAGFNRFNSLAGSETLRRSEMWL